MFSFNQIQDVIKDREMNPRLFEDAKTDVLRAQGAFSNKSKIDKEVILHLLHEAPKEVTVGMASYITPDLHSVTNLPENKEPPKTNL